MFTDNGSLTLGADVWKLRYTTIDTTGGNSGSGIYQDVAGIRYVGTHLAVAAGDAYNFGRRWDSTYYNFVDANSPFPGG